MIRSLDATPDNVVCVHCHKAGTLTKISAKHDWFALPEGWMALVIVDEDAKEDGDAVVNGIAVSTACSPACARAFDAEHAEEAISWGRWPTTWTPWPRRR